MQFARHQTLPFPTRPAVLPPRTSASVVPAAVVPARQPDPTKRERVVIAGMTKVRASRGSSATPIGLRATRAPASTPGASFAAKRIAHAVEMFGACMMIATFLVLALFG